MACIPFFTLVIILAIQGLLAFLHAILDYLFFDAVRNNAYKTHHSSLLQIILFSDHILEILFFIFAPS